MDNKEVVSSLREWAPLTEIIDLIPSRIQKGIFPTDLSITCFDVIPEFIAFGTDSGIVFWYNRINGEIQKLRAEVTSSISCVRIVSSVEYMVAAGNTFGQVSVFQIQKKLPTSINIVAPLTKTKPIQRYTIRDLHKTIVRCTEWSKNGMKLFSGDKNGVVVLTEFDYQMQLSKSFEILNESYDIVQLCVYQSHLLISTLYRTIVCEREQNRWRISQVGQIDRNVMGEFGAAYIHEEEYKLPKIIVCRPDQQFWITDTDGLVERSLNFQHSLSNNRSMWEIPLLNPTRYSENSVHNFGVVIIYRENLVITYDESVLYILNLTELKIVAIAKGFRKILSVNVCGNEIFVLEGSRSLLRLAPNPEPPNKKATIIFNPLHPPPLPLMGVIEQPIEFEAEEDYVLNAEECFELPPIELLQLDIPIQTVLDSPGTEQTKLLIEKNRRVEVLNKISELDFEDSILFHSSKKLHRKGAIGGKKNKKPAKTDVLLTPDQSNINSPKDSMQNEKIVENLVPKSPEFINQPYPMDASFYNSSLIITDPQSPETLQRNLKLKEKILAEELNLEPVKLCEITGEDLLNTQFEYAKHQPYSVLQTFNYPNVVRMDDAQVQTTPIKKPHFNVDDDYADDNNEQNLNFNDETNITNYSYLNYSNSSGYNNGAHKYTLNSNQSDENDYLRRNGKTMHFKSCRPLDILSPLPTTSAAANCLHNTNDTCEIQNVPTHMNIPTLWNIQNKSTEPDESPQPHSYTSSEWEFVEDNKN